MGSLSQSNGFKASVCTFVSGSNSAATNFFFFWASLNSHDAVKYATTQHTKRLPMCVNFTTCTLTAAEVNMLLIVLNQHCPVLPVQVTRLLEVAVKNRAVAATDCNERSSRSHCLFRLTLSGTNHKSKETCSGKFSI